MTDHFPAAVGRTLVFEGGFVDNPADPGGATKHGISQRFLRLVGLTDDVREMTTQRAVDIYREYFWDMYNCGLIEDGEIAGEYFDFLVLAGPRASGLCLQRALRSTSYATNKPGLRVTEDGIVGPLTARSANESPRFPLLAALKSEQAGYARDLDNPTFERGWVRRAYQ